MNLNILLLQRELRADENNLIEFAIHLKKPFVPVFIFDESEFHYLKNKRSKAINFLVSAVLKLKDDLRKVGSDLIILNGDKYKILSKLVKVLDSERIIVGETYQEKINGLYKKLSKNVDVDIIADSFLTHFDVLKDDGEPFKVFTPYKNFFVKNFKPENLEVGKKIKKGQILKVDFKKVITGIKKGLEKGFLIEDKDCEREKILKKIGFETSDFSDFDVEDGEKRFKEFMSDTISKYKKGRDYPAIEGTSKLSPYFRNGVVSVRKCFLECWKNRKKKGVKQWMFELIWREFYATTLYHNPEMMDKEFMEKYRKIKWEYDKKMLQAWKDGKTGYPIVDAGMRQLKEIGWMHNRVRMVVASFLTKNLLIDWRLGDEHFANYLIDYEPASNVGGWQWSASVGVDPQPYFRIFSPFSQTKRFDKNGEYILRYIPGLKGSLVGKNRKFEIKKLKDELEIEGYYKKIVDYKKSRKRALKAFKGV